MKPDEVIRQRMCLGCGLCLGPETHGNSMQCDEDGFLVPRFDGRRESPGFESICPGLTQNSGRWSGHPVWGGVRDCLIAYASDPVVRFRGSSGGAVSAIAIHAIESGLVDAVLHVGHQPGDPLKNELFISNSAGDVSLRASSRYAPAVTFPPWFWALKETGKRYLYIGKPCDIGAIRNLQRLDDRWSKTIPLTVAIFCAGMPSMKATSTLIEKLGLGSVPASVRYRGEGWPGRFRAIGAGGEEVSADYSESWGSTLNQFLHPRCHICPDGIGIQADVAAGDPWDSSSGYPDFAERPGLTLLLPRTGSGEDLVKSALLAGVLVLERRLAIGEVDKMQPYQRDRRGRIAYRLIGRASAGYAIPRFRNFRLIQAAREIGAVSGFRQAFGTWLRLRGRRILGQLRSRFWWR